jgi:hypothetical protein
MLMLLDERQIMQIVQQLLNKTKASQAQWRLASGMYYLGLSDDTTIALFREPDVSPDVYVVRIIAPTNELLGELRATENDSTYSLVKVLYDHIRERVSTDLFDEILQEVSQAGVIGKARPEPSFRPRPTPEQVERLLTSLSGEWLLEEWNGMRTRVTVDRLGMYYARSQSQPEYQLKILACNSDCTVAEVGKELLDGRRVRVEVLEIAPDQMKGVVKHTGETIKYIRTRPSPPTNVKIEVVQS